MESSQVDINSSGTHNARHLSSKIATALVEQNEDFTNLSSMPIASTISIYSVVPRRVPYAMLNVEITELKRVGQINFPSQVIPKSHPLSKNIYSSTDDLWKTETTLKRRQYDIKQLATTKEQLEANQQDKNDDRNISLVFDPGGEIRYSTCNLVMILDTMITCHVFDKLRNRNFMILNVFDRVEGLAIQLVILMFDILRVFPSSSIRDLKWLGSWDTKFDTDNHHSYRRPWGLVMRLQSLNHDLSSKGYYASHSAQKNGFKFVRIQGGSILLLLENIVSLVLAITLTETNSTGICWPLLMPKRVALFDVEPMIQLKHFLLVLIQLRTTMLVQDSMSQLINFCLICFVDTLMNSISQHFLVGSFLSRTSIAMVEKFLVELKRYNVLHVQDTSGTLIFQHFAVGLLFHPRPVLHGNFCHVVSKHDVQVKKMVDTMGSNFEGLGMCCATEAALVERSLKPLHDVQDISAIVHTKTLTVVLDALLISDSQLVDALNIARLEASFRLQRKTNYLRTLKDLSTPNYILIVRVEDFDLRVRDPDKVLHQLYVILEKLKQKGTIFATEVQNSLRIIVEKKDSIVSRHIAKSAYLKMGHTQGWLRVALFQSPSWSSTQLAEVNIVNKQGPWEESMVCLNPWETQYKRKSNYCDTWLIWSPILLYVQYYNVGIIEIIGFRDTWHSFVLLAAKGDGNNLAQASKIPFEFHKHIVNCKFMGISENDAYSGIPSNSMGLWISTHGVGFHL